MSELIKPRFEHVPSKVAGLVHAHRTVATAVHTHAQAHQDARFKREQMMATERNMMNAVKGSGNQ